MQNRLLLFLLASFFLGNLYAQNGKIDRKALVQRHTVVVNKFDTLSSLTVGNGAFAFTVDATGLQSFPEAYAKGVPLGTQSEWGWHSFPNKNHYSFSDALKTYQLNGRPVQYAVQWNSPEKNKAASNYFRENEHRLQLGNIGFEIVKKDGTTAGITDIQEVHQTLDMWTGEVHSQFMVESVPVDVVTYGHQQADAVAVKIKSPLLQEGRLRLRIRFPFPTNAWADMGINWKNEEAHTSTLMGQKSNEALIQHTLDTTTYYTAISWKNSGTVKEQSRHYFILTPGKAATFEAGFRFSARRNSPAPPFEATAASSRQGWAAYWQSGGAIDFAGSSDKRAFEIERRMILSQYLLKAQEGGSNPPQETGLTYNSWYGKPHMEMIWWHSLQYALWGRTGLLEKQMSWYQRAAARAREIAQRQGYEGVRWQKMTDNEGRESPSSIGAFLVWQQPHLIVFAELCYRNGDKKAALKKWSDLLYTTADFMASFARYDSVKQKYVLGKGIIAAQERFKAEETFNPTYELVYWHWALETAQQWRLRNGGKRSAKWDAVLKGLSPLPVQGDKYLFTESATDSYTNPEFKTDHPSVFGALGMLPQTPMLDRKLMANTFDWIWKNWSWNDTWGWDFPMTAMTATRLGDPEKAIEALLMPVQTNTYLPNGHNYQDGRLTIYLPGNGGLLTALAMMTAGYDGSGNLPGIPKDGRWKVKWEGLAKMP